MRYLFVLLIATSLTGCEKVSEFLSSSKEKECALAAREYALAVEKMFLGKTQSEITAWRDASIAALQWQRKACKDNAAFPKP